MSVYLAVGEGDPSSYYWGQGFYRQDEDQSWILDFTITRNVNSLATRVEDDYISGGWTKHHTQRLEYEEATTENPRQCISFKIAEPADDKQKDWEVTLISADRFEKSVVDQQTEKDNIPVTSFGIRWMGSSDTTPCSTVRKIKLLGMKGPCNNLSIFLPQKSLAVERNGEAPAPIPTVPLPVPTATLDTLPGGPLIVKEEVPVKVKRKFDILQARFKTAFVRAFKMIKEKDLTALKQYLSAAFQDTEDQVNDLGSMVQLEKFLRDNSSFTDFPMLEGLASYFDLEKVGKELVSYTEYRSNMYAQLLAEDFEAAGLNQCVKDSQTKIVFVVRWERNEATLRRFEAMVTQAFENARKFIHLKAVHSSLLTFICVAQNRTVDSLIQVAWESVGLLKQLGVVKLTIGQEVILHDKEALEYQLLEIRTERDQLKHQLLKTRTEIDQLKHQLLEMHGDEIFRKAMQHGVVKVRLMNCLCQGPSQVGKTHVEHLLLGIKLQHCKSTVRANTPLRAVTVNRRRSGGGSLKKWEIVDHEKMLKMLAEEIKLTKENELSRPKNGASPTQGARRPSTLTRSGELLQEITSANISQTGDSLPLRVSSAEGSPKLSALDELLQCISRAKGSPEISGHQWMHFIDSGGQPQFQEVLQAFIPNTTVLLLVFKLTERLSDIPLAEYQSEEGSLHDLGSHSLRNQQILLRLVRMLVLGQDQSGTTVQIIFVGTFRDEYQKMLDEGKEGIESVEEKQELLEELFEPLMDNIVYYTQEDMIFPVNGLLAEDGKFGDPVVLKLRNVLNTLLSEVEEIPVPLRWYALEAALQKKAKSRNRSVVSREECVNIAKSLQLKKEETTEALKFLSDRNIIHYYPDVLKNVIFTNPQVTLGIVTDLVEIVCNPHSLQSLELTARGRYIKDLKNGEVAMNVIRDLIPRSVRGLVKPQDLVVVLESLYVVARLDDTKCFMPALLTSFPSQKLVELRNPKHLPLLYHFQSEPGPAGLFCALVVYLISKQRWKVCHNKPPLRGSFWNAMTLRGPGMPVTVTIVDSISQFEIYCQDHVNFPEEKFLPKIKDTVKTALQSVVRERKYGIDPPEPAFFCRVCGEDSYDHPAEIGMADTLICLETDESTRLNEQEKEWLLVEQPRDSSSPLVATQHATTDFEASAIPRPSAPVTVPTRFLDFNPSSVAAVPHMPAFVAASLPASSAPSIVLARVLDEDDLEDVINELYGISDVMLLGQNLGIRASTLQMIEKDYRSLKKGLTRVIYHWLKRIGIEQHRQNEHPTWSVLANAVEPIKPKLAEVIRDQYCS